MNPRFHRGLRTAAAALLLAASIASAAAAAKPQAGAPFLWKIEGAGKKPSWLFGTIHLARPDVTQLPSSVAGALDESDAVYTEIPADMATLVELVPKMMLPGGQSIDQMLDSKSATALEAEIQAINPELSLAPLSQLKPWALAASLMQLEDQMKYPGALALDMVLYQRAAMAGKRVGGIETPDEQVAVFDGFSNDEQIVMVNDTVRQLHEMRTAGRSVSDLLAQLYLAGDLDTLVNELRKLDLTEDPKLTEKFMDRLLYQRNAVMAGRIVQFLHDEPGASWFFAVGAAHLQGRRGLIGALEKAGFRLTRVQ